MPVVAVTAMGTPAAAGAAGGAAGVAGAAAGNLAPTGVADDARAGAGNGRAAAAASAAAAVVALGVGAPPTARTNGDGDADGVRRCAGVLAGRALTAVATADATVTAVGAGGLWPPLPSGGGTYAYVMPRRRLDAAVADDDDAADTADSFSGRVCSHDCASSAE